MLERFPAKTGQPIGYIEYKSAKFDAAKTPKGFLLAHGIGNRGDATATNVFGWVNDEGAEILALIDSGNFVLIAPQLLPEKKWTNDYFDFAYEQVRSKYNVDPKVFVSGISWGGQAIWPWSAANPDKVAGVIGCCPVYEYADFCKIKCPVVDVHGKLDPMVSIDQSRSAISQIQQCGGNAMLIELPVNYHEIWKRDVYSRPEVKTLLSISSLPQPVQPSQPVSVALKADASATVTNVTGTTAALDGSKSVGYKQTGSFKDLSWNLISQPEGSDWNVFPGFIKVGEKVNLKNLSKGDYVFELVARDEKGNTSKDRVAIAVSAGKKIFKKINVDGENIILYEDKTYTVE